VQLVHAGEFPVIAGPTPVRATQRVLLFLILGAGLAGMSAALELATPAYKSSSTRIQRSTRRPQLVAARGDTYTNWAVSTQHVQFAEGCI